MSELIPDGTYLIKYGPNEGVGGEYITGGGPGKVVTIQALGPDLSQSFDIQYNFEKQAYTFKEHDDAPRFAGISYEEPKAGSPVIIERPRYFRIVSAGVAFKIVAAEETSQELVVAVSPTKPDPPTLHLAPPIGSDDIWQFVLEKVD